MDDERTAMGRTECESNGIVDDHPGEQSSRRRDQLVRPVRDLRRPLACTVSVFNACSVKLTPLYLPG